MIANLDFDTIVMSLREVIANPTSNLTAAVLMLSAVAIVLLMLTLALFYLILPRPAPEGRSRSASAPSVPPATPAGKPKGLMGPVGTWLIAVLLAGGLIAAYVTTSQDFYCASCHVRASEADGPETSIDEAHASTRCVRCHEDSSAVLANSVARAGDLAAELGLIRSLYPDAIPSRRCLRCHRSQLSAGVIVNPVSGVAMSHDEPLDAGWGCVECHEGAGHRPMEVPAAMSKCLGCHDARLASAECATCHRLDPTKASTLRSERIFGTAQIITRDCEGCHDSASCDSCHGLRLPHTDEFLTRHARYAAFEKKEMCFEKCHQTTDCVGCHSPPWEQHGPDFKRAHQTLSRDLTCGTCHRGHDGPMCDLCHDF